ncbi:A-kinase anchor protein 13-like [Morone saxatilis]|uniref:A-kinase anchor protein 13-like n=1 Tax=Morone saxatilis TaxID=34816 RepID=UPI0015E214DC|nr:A-kinase anchor protein 13-like [Morone saxatilis]
MDRPQTVRFGTLTSTTRTLSTGSPQGCVLSPFLYALYTYDCAPLHHSNIIVKFADDTTVVGLISGGDETAYREEVQRLAAWCSANNLLLNASKTKEMVMDWRRKRADPAPLQIEGDCVERVSSFKFLGVHVADNLTWSTNTSAVVGKAQLRLHFLRLLRKCDLDVHLLRSFYRSTIESVLTYCLTIWYPSCTAKDRKAQPHSAKHCGQSSVEKDEDEGVPSETEEDRRQQDNRAKEIRELLRRKDEQIISLLEEKVHIFRDLSDYDPALNDTNPPVRERMLFRATPDDVTKGEPIIKDALREMETLHALVSSCVGGAGCSVPVGLAGGSVGPVSLPRRAETFGGFDSHQMNSSKNGEKEEGDELLDLRRTESDSVLKKGATASLQMLLKRNSEVQNSVTNLHDLLISLQAVVVQQDSFVEDQRQALSDRLTANSSRHSSSSSLSSSSSSRPSSLIEQEKHRSLERQRQEAASLQKQLAAHQEEKRRREKVWELKEKGLAEREERLRVEEEETRRRGQELMEERDTLQRKKEEYQRDLEKLREAQRRLERDNEALRRDTERLEAMKRDESEQLQRYQRTPSTTSEDSIRFHSSGSLDLDSKEAAEQPKEVELSSSAPTKEPFLRIGSKRMGKNFNPFSSSSSSKPQGAEKESQLPTRLLQLAKSKGKKDKKKKKGKGGEQTQKDSTVMLDHQNDGDIFFC